MPKAKRKPEAKPGDFTDQIRAGDGFADARVVMMPGEAKREALHTRRKLCPAMRWSWLTEAERGALVRYADLHEQADPTVKGCLAPQGGGEPLLGAERRIARRDAHTAAKRACSPTALAFTEHVLVGDRPANWEDAANIAFGAPRQHARMMGRAMIGIVARDLVRFFG